MTNQIQTERLRANLIDTSVAARVLGWSPRTIRKWLYLGKIRGIRSSDAPKAPWLYSREEIHSIKNENQS